MAVFLMGSFVQMVYRHVQHYSAKSIIKIWLDNNQQWHWSNRSGESFHGQLQHDSVCSRMLIILHLQCVSTENRKKKISVVIFPDSVDATSFRRLRMHLFSQKP
ncbi:MAG: hypothetical protein JKY13_03170 [Gammaproteobacteria bacterium]|nr:hypothetical protein [Gammaproteobacteria bacterium]